MFSTQPAIERARGAHPDSGVVQSKLRRVSIATYTGRTRTREWCGLIIQTQVESTHVGLRATTFGLQSISMARAM